MKQLYLMFFFTHCMCGSQNYVDNLMGAIVKSISDDEAFAKALGVYEFVKSADATPSLCKKNADYIRYIVRLLHKNFVNTAAFFLQKMCPSEKVVYRLICDLCGYNKQSLFF